VGKNPEYWPQISENNEPSSSFLFDKRQLKIIETEIIITLPSTYLHDTKVSTANPFLDNNHKTPSFMTQLFDPSPQTFIRTDFYS